MLPKADIKNHYYPSARTSSGKRMERLAEAISGTDKKKLMIHDDMNSILEMLTSKLVCN